MIISIRKNAKFDTVFDTRKRKALHCNENSVFVHGFDSPRLHHRRAIRTPSRYLPDGTWFCVSLSVITESSVLFFGTEDSAFFALAARNIFLQFRIILFFFWLRIRHILPIQYSHEGQWNSDPPLHLISPSLFLIMRSTQRRNRRWVFCMLSHQQMQWYITTALIIPMRIPALT